MRPDCSWEWENNQVGDGGKTTLRAAVWAFGFFKKGGGEWCADVLCMMYSWGFVGGG